MTPAELSRTVLATVRRAVEAGELAAPVPDRVIVEQPRRPGCGDYATSVALQLAGPAERPPRAVAEILRARLTAEPGISGVEIAGPGFLNISLDAASRSGLLVTVLAQGTAYGHSDEFAGTTVELHRPDETRAVVTADALARILEASGAEVTVVKSGTADPAWAALGVRDVAVGGDGVPVGSDAGPDREVVQVRPVPVRVGEGDRPAATAPASTAITAASAPAPTAATASTTAAPAPTAVAAPDASPAPATPAATLLARLGPDAARWALLRPAAHEHPRPTDDLLVQHETNPLFRVRYAHARARALVRNAADLGVTPDPAAIDDTRAEARAANPGATTATGTPAIDPAADHTPAGDPAADALLAALAAYPQAVRSAARHRAPDRLARHLVVIADAFFRFHDTCAVLPRGEQKPEAAHRVRTALAQASATVLAGGLNLLGITAPDML